MSNFGIRNRIVDQAIITYEVPKNVRECLYQVMMQDLEGKGLDPFTKTDPSKLERILCRLNGIFLKTDEITNKRDVLKQIHLFLLNCDYYKVYELIEDYLSLLDSDLRKTRVRDINTALSHGNMGFRSCEAGQFVRLTSEEEIKELDKAASTKFDKVNACFKKALKKYSFESDWQGCISESFNALETLLSILIGTKGSFGDLLNKLKSKGVFLHEALAQSLKKLYGYASDVARHGSKDEYQPSDAEARFVLITNSALCNFMVAIFEGCIGL